MNKLCQICKQKADVYTTVHKKYPYINGKTYDVLCFTCYFVPKIQHQKYDKNGYISEEVDLPYCCENLCTPKELFELGSADSLKKAKISVEAVKKLCAGKKNKNLKRPKAEWIIK